MRPVTLRIGTAVILAALSAAEAPSGQTQPRQPPIRRQANYVRVDVYPTRDGVPITDLRAEDFEVFENGERQTVSAFEYVSVTSAGPQAQRVDPPSVDAARQAAANPRSRVFVIFLDAKQVTVEATWHIREPLIRLVDRILAPDDLVAIMTPGMAPSQITLARKTDVIEGGLRNIWPWGTRHTIQEDAKEAQYNFCYPPNEDDVRAGRSSSSLAKALIDRRAERLTLEALKELVYHLRDLREERKAVLTVSEGWLLYRPNPELMKLRAREAVPGIDPIGVGVGGKIRSRDTIENIGGASQYECDVDRMRLAQADNEQYFRDIIDEANRANTSFYTIDPRGLAAADSPIGPERPPPVMVDQARLRARLENMRTLAGATDGLAVLTSNDLDKGLKRISDDLTSYYLLGYYSTNTRLDGTYRRITVRVTRAGVDVRARRGYRAPTQEEVASARAAADPEPAGGEMSAMESALGALARIRPDARFRIHAAPAAGGNGGEIAAVWVAGELQPPPATDPWTRGGTAEIDVTSGDDRTTARVTLGAGERTFLARVVLPAPVSGGALDVRARLSGTDPAAAHLADSVHVPLAPGARPPLLFRRGPTTGNRLLPAATFLFSRTERVRVDVPVDSTVKPGTARLQDRTGQPVPLPVVVSDRTDEATGQRWISADVTLAPLGAGDYTIELTLQAPGPGGSGSEHKVITAIRVAR